MEPPPHREAQLETDDTSELTRLEQLLVEAGVAVFENHPFEIESLRETLGELRRESTMRNWQPLFNAAIELSIQNSVRRGEFPAAEYFLSLTQDDLINKKWSALFSLYRGGTAQVEALQALHWVREHAVATGDWELARDCDLHQALACRDQALALKLYFGTPYEKFRERLLEAAAGWMEILPEQYDFAPKGESSRAFDIAAGREAQRASLRRGKNLHRLLTRLASDFYRPFLFSEADGQKYALIAHRLRVWFEDYEIPLGVQISGSSVKLLWKGTYALRVVQGLNTSLLPDKDLIQIEDVMAHFGERSFTSRQVADHLKVSVRSAVHILAIALEQKFLIRSGNGRSTLYSSASNIASNIASDVASDSVAEAAGIYPARSPRVRQLKAG